MFQGEDFLFTFSDTFALGCTIQLQYTHQKSEPLKFLHLEYGCSVSRNSSGTVCWLHSLALHFRCEQTWCKHKLTIKQKTGCYCTVVNNWFCSYVICFMQCDRPCQQLLFLVFLLIINGWSLYVGCVCRLVARWSSQRSVRTTAERRLLGWYVWTDKLARRYRHSRTAVCFVTYLLLTESLAP